MRTIALSLFVLAAYLPGQTADHDAALQKLTASLEALRENSVVGASHRDRITSDILALAEPSHEPSLSSVVLFTNRLAGALAGRQLPASQASRLATEIDVVLRSAGIGHWRFKEAIASLEAALISAGVNHTAARKVATDLELVGTQVRGPEGIPARPLR